MTECHLPTNSMTNLCKVDGWRFQAKMLNTGLNSSSSSFYVVSTIIGVNLAVSGYYSNDV